jgi:RNA polymerase sigma factor (sigma-70 family)
MATQQLPRVFRHIRRLIGGAEALTDAQLLQRFADRHDEAAFAEIVRRHGPLVLGLCRRLLRQHPDAEDAFQATFLVLARRAGSVRRQASLASWLYGVAHRLALNARSAAGRRARVRTAADLRAADLFPAESDGPADLMDRFPERYAMRADPADELSRREARAALAEELGALPERYRAPLLLCYLEGMTNDEAARRLSWASGTLKGRLARGRELLRARLARRGLALSAGAVGALLAEGSARAAVTAALLTATTRAALAFAAGRAVAGGATLLAEGVLNTLLLSKIKVALALTVTMTLLGAGAVSLVHQAAFAQPAAAGDGPKAEPAPGEQAKPAGTDRHGDPLPEGALARLGTVRLRHGQAVNVVAFLPDGKHLLSGGQDGTARLWDLATGREVRRFSKPRAAAPGPPAFRFGGFAVALSPDGRALATCDGLEEVTLWDVATGKETRAIRLAGMEGATALVFAPDGKTLAGLAPGPEIVLWDAAKGEELRRINKTGEERGPKFWFDGASRSLAFSPDGKGLLMTNLERGANLRVVLKLFDAQTGKELRSVVLAGGEPRVIGPTFSPDGKLLAYADPEGSVYLADAATGKDLHRLRGEGVARFAFAPDGKTLVTRMAGDGVVAVWDVATGKELRRFGKPGERPTGVRWNGFASLPGLAVSPDGKTLASAGDGICLTLLDLATGKEALALGGHRSGVTAVRYGPDGKTVISCGGDSTVRTWEAATGKEVGEFRLPAGVLTHQLSRDGRTLVTREADGTVRVWDATTGKERHTFGGTPQAFSSLGLSPDGKTLVGSDPRERVLRLYDTVSGKELRSIGLQAGAPDGVMVFLPLTSAFSADGKLVAAARAVNVVGVWEAATGREVRSVALPEGQKACTAAFSPDGRSLAVETADGAITLWELATGKERRLYGERGKTPQQPEVKVVAGGAGVVVEGFSLAHLAGGATLAFSPDGRLLAQARGSSVILRDVLTGKELGKLAGHQGDVVTLAFAPDGRTLTTGSTDTTAVVWDAAPFAAKAAPAGRDVPAKELAARWDALAGDDAAKAFEAAGELVVSRQAVAFLAERLKPSAAADARQIEKWIAELDSNEFAVREKASAELRKLGGPAMPAMRKALAGDPSAEVRRQLEDLIAQAGNTTLSGDELRVWRAVEVLERLGTPEAREVLSKLAKGAPGALTTEAAREALERMGR